MTYYFVLFPFYICNCY